MEAEDPAVPSARGQVAGPAWPAAEQAVQKMADETPSLDAADEKIVGIIGDVLSISEETFFGPLPHPEHLRAYEEIVPGSGSRIIAMTEAEGAHRQNLTNRHLLYDFIYAMTGTVLGFLIAVTLLIMAYVSSQNGHEGVALGFLAASTVGMVASFIKGRAWLRSRPDGPGSPPD